MKHYYVFSVIQGLLLGFAYFMVFGHPLGFWIAVVMSAWGVISAIDAAADDNKLNKEGRG